MSTTTALGVAVQYAMSQHPTLLKLRTTSSMERGAELGWLSVFPAEEEVCFPPLTFLDKPSKVGSVEIGDVKFRVIEVQKVHFPTT